jgi:hypothetical protein
MHRSGRRPQHLSATLKLLRYSPEVVSVKLWSHKCLSCLFAPPRSGFIATFSALPTRLARGKLGVLTCNAVCDDARPLFLLDPDVIKRTRSQINEYRTRVARSRHNLPTDLWSKNQKTVAGGESLGFASLLPSTSMVGMAGFASRSLGKAKYSRSPGLHNR